MGKGRCYIGQDPIACPLGDRAVKKVYFEILLVVCIQVRPDP